MKQNNIDSKLVYFSETPDVTHLGLVIKKYPNVSMDDFLEEILDNFDKLVKNSADFCFLLNNFKSIGYQDAIFKLLYERREVFTTVFTLNPIVATNALSNIAPLISLRELENLLARFKVVFPGVEIPKEVSSRVDSLSADQLNRSGALMGLFKKQKQQQLESAGFSFKGSSVDEHAKTTDPDLASKKK